MIPRVVGQQGSADPAEAALLARLLPEALNRGQPPDEKTRGLVEELYRQCNLLRYADVQRSMSPMGSYVGLPHFHIPELSDGKSDELRSSLVRALTTLTNRSADGEAFTSKTGMRLPGDVGRGSKNTEDMLEYGGPLALYQQLTWVPPVSDGTPTANNAKNAERPPVTDRENALAYLGSVLAPDQRLNIIRARMMAAIPRMVGSEDKELVGATLDGAMRDLDHVYQNEGLAAALDMAMQYEHGKVFYLETQVPRHDAAGKLVMTETLVRPKLLTNDQIRGVQTTLGVDRAGLDALSRLNYKSLPNTWKADDRWSAQTQASLFQQEQ